MFGDPTPHFFVVLDVLPEDPTYDAANPGTWMVVISTDGLFGPVPRTCQVTLNGQPAKITDLKVGDVIDAAIERETAVSDYYPPFIIWAHREVVEGNVASTSTSYPGPIDRVTIDLKTGGRKTYVVDHNGTIGGLPGKGDLLARIDYETLTPYVVLKSFVASGSGAGETYSATFDVRGEEKTYKLDGDVIDGTWDVADLIGDYLYIEVDTGTNTVEFIDDEDLVVYGYNAADDLIIGDWCTPDGAPIFELTDLTTLPG